VDQRESWKFWWLEIIKEREEVEKNDESQSKYNNAM